jgi:hypothetical protein
MRRRIKILYISDKPLKRLFFKCFIQYKFFDYSNFKKEDNIIGMYQRLFTLCCFFNPHIIILKFNHTDMINEGEKKQLRKFGIVLELKNAETAIEHSTS